MNSEKDSNGLEYRRHYYLYAKLHYEKSDNLIEDLKKIQAATFGYDIEYVNVADIMHSLLTLVYKHYFAGVPEDDSIHPNEMWFIEFVNDIQPERDWLFRQVHKKWTFETAVCAKCLSMLMMTKVRDGDKIILNLGEADPKILPLHVVKKQEEKQTER